MSKRGEGLRALSLDGSINPENAPSELHILDEAAGRWAWDSGRDNDGEDVRPTEMFDIICGTGLGGFYAILFGALNLTIGQAMKAHLVLTEKLFSSDAWTNKNRDVCAINLSRALDQIEQHPELPLSEASLNLPFSNHQHAKLFVCVVNDGVAATCRLLRNYRTRAAKTPTCTIKEALIATLSDHVHLPPARIQKERFLSASYWFANPTRVLMKELQNAFPPGSQVACLVNIGSGSPSLLGFVADGEPATILRSCEDIAEEVATQCHHLGPFFFRLSVAGLQQPQSAQSDTDIFSLTKGLTVGYLATEKVSEDLEHLVEIERNRKEVISIERLGEFLSLAGPDGQSQPTTQVARLQHPDKQLLRKINAWLQPIHQTSKLDANIVARDKTTCNWLLRHATFIRWMELKRGLFWLHGLMGTGKTVMSSFVIQNLLSRDDIVVAYYYFEITNPATLSEEAMLRSLIVQLSKAAPAEVRTFHEDHDFGSLQPQLNSLQAILNEVLSASLKPIFIILDALDEVPAVSRKYLFPTLLNFSHSDTTPFTHVMVTSREDIDIRRAFETNVDFQLGVQGDLVRQDIAAFVDHQLDAKKWSFWPRHEVEVIRKSVKDTADGQFRMAACQMEILQQVKSSKQMQETLTSLPKNLMDTYDYILGTIPSMLRPQAHRLFAILSFSYKAIHAYELSVLLAVEFEPDDNLPRLDERNRFYDPLDVLELGSSLVSQSDNLIQLAHASVKVHLLTHLEAWFSLKEGPAHDLIASANLSIILYSQDKTQKESQNSRDTYSKSHWYMHIFPKGPPALLRQQKKLYTCFPWQSLESCGVAHSALSSAASLGLVDLLGTFLESGESNAETLADALVAATGSGRLGGLPLECCQLLVRHGANLEAHCPLQVAALKGNLGIVRFLVEKGADVNAVGGSHGTALHAASFEGKQKIVEFLVERDADINKVVPKTDADTNKDINVYGTPLHAAALGERLHTVRYLLASGADANKIGGQFGTPLQAAASVGNFELVEIFVKSGADINIVGGQFGTALQAAAVRWDYEVVRYLIKNGANVNTVGGRYGSPLIAATFEGRLPTVRFLVENGADVNNVGRTAGYGFFTIRGIYEIAIWTALDAAYHSRMESDEEIIKYLRGHGAKCYTELSTPRDDVVREDIRSEQNIWNHSNSVT
ncbi:hypothetical protein DL96DRAFT_1713251 [Flagelloscypha sp. PMI_526]|nr:hypothetical protein DL96DRAFT_1713251 [Flagelloscypha sp. PMI_526]